MKIYGQRFTGNWDGWIHPDLFPDQFHRFVEMTLFKDKTPFVMDHDAGVEVWNVPVYKTNYSIQKYPGNKNAVLVTMWLYHAAPFELNEKDNIGTKMVTREYHYVLYGERDSSNKLTVSAGAWIKNENGVDSRADHPDYVVVVSGENIKRKSLNKGLDVSLIDTLINKSTE